MFSTYKVLIVIVLLSLLLATTFSPPWYLFFYLHAFVSLVLLPPFLWVGVFNTKGKIRAFFMGAIVSGIPHFMIVCQLMVRTSFGFNNFSGGPFGIGYSGNFWPRIYMLLMFLPGLFGGLSGMGSYFFLLELPKIQKKREEEKRIRRQFNRKAGDPFADEDEAFDNPEETPIG